MAQCLREKSLRGHDLYRGSKGDQIGRACGMPTIVMVVVVGVVRRGGCDADVLES